MKNNFEFINKYIEHLGYQPYEFLYSKDYFITNIKHLLIHFFTTELMSDPKQTVALFGYKNLTNYYYITGRVALLLRNEFMQYLYNEIKERFYAQRKQVISGD